ncbi:MAG: sugar ABC transporter permease [Rhodobacteraceae bacterium]|nr:sugar ABC transporter permease [Paracoccaceae bacterium]MYF47355.1 sugar ABC transporter permease [Paracoccaceae bacterium]MYI90359.1 sugar ABC transporter permease [Paracoccaceae bacterium]
MKAKTFLAFVAPSVASMLLLIALPLVGVVFLSVYQSYVKTELREVTTEVPLFGGQTREVTRTVPQPVLDENGDTIFIWEYVGGRNLREASEIEGVVETFRGPFPQNERLGGKLNHVYKRISNYDFWSALEFTLLYTFFTTPAILIIGLGVALAVNRVTEGLRGPLVFISLLPMIVTPIVSSSAIFWMFLDNGIVSVILEQLGFGQIYFLSNQISTRILIILYGIWFAAPFAFIILYAGLQTMPRDPLESAMIDGANAWQRLRYVIIPHLTPLLAVITMIHVMDAYRVFEPILVFGTSVYANSVQYLTYFVLGVQDNIHKAAAYSILTIIGVVILLIPILRHTFKEQKAIN